MYLNNKVYDILKWIALVVLPATGTFYFALSKVWPLPYGEEIVATLSAITTFIGAILQVSSSNYPGDGIIEIDRETQENADTLRIHIDTPVDTMTNKKTVTLKVQPNATIPLGDSQD